jgi:hypothetical protein
MDLESKKTFDSVSTPGVKFTLRRLNQRQRAMRDLKIADEKLEYDKALGPFLKLEEEWKGRESERSPEVLAEVASLNYRMGLILNAHIKPATIRAALISIGKVGESGKLEPLTVDGKPYTPDTFVELCDKDELMDEIWIEAETLAGLKVRQAENFSSPSPSQEAAAGGNPLTSATSATTMDTGEIETVLSSMATA